MEENKQIDPNHPVEPDVELEKSEEDKLKERYDQLFNQKLGQYHVRSAFKLDKSSKLAFFAELKRDWSNHLERIKDVPKQLAEPYEKPEDKSEVKVSRALPHEHTSANFEQKIVGLIDDKPRPTKSTKGKWVVDYYVSVPFGNGKTETSAYFFKKPEAQQFIDRLKSESNGDVGQTIHRQIQTLDRRALMAWGAKDFVTGIHNPVFTDKPEIGEGLQFKVNGPLHKGYLIILLTPQDNYTIVAYTLRGVNIKVKKTIRGIFVSDLVKAIDSIVG